MEHNTGHRKAPERVWRPHEEAGWSQAALCAASPASPCTQPSSNLGGHRAELSEGVLTPLLDMPDALVAKNLAMTFAGGIG
jgi:hypothetical protein